MTDTYDASHIATRGLRPVRERPAMYVGTDARGLHHLVYEVVDNSVDEKFLAGFCDLILVIINRDGSVTVKTTGVVSRSISCPIRQERP